MDRVVCEAVELAGVDRGDGGGPPAGESGEFVGDVPAQAAVDPEPRRAARTFLQKKLDRPAAVEDVELISGSHAVPEACPESGIPFPGVPFGGRSEEHTSELQSQF